jgi:Zn ribbon nucleic-acid-binding protein
MKSYHVLECANQKQIANELHSFLLNENGVLEKDNLKFWNFLNKKELFNCLKECAALSQWFETLGLKVREGSFTVYNNEIKTSPHVDAPPVVAKINFPVINTRDTYNVWFDQNKNEIDRVECVSPIVLRSNIPHTVEIGKRACFPRIQMSFCFYNEPIDYLK